MRFDLNDVSSPNLEWQFLDILMQNSRAPLLTEKPDHQGFSSLYCRSVKCCCTQVDLVKSILDTPGVAHGDSCLAVFRLITNIHVLKG